jgi:hypothetical protein
MLTFNDNLTWRDVKHIISKSCIVCDETAGEDADNVDDTPWFTNKADMSFNLQYGFGLINVPKIIENTKNHTLLKNQCGVKLDISENINLSTDKNISFTVNENNIKAINDDIQITTSLEHFIIEEFTIVFESLKDEGDTNHEVHQLSISFTVANRYYSDYNNQNIVIGREVEQFETNEMTNHPFLCEFLRGEKIVGDTNESTWTINLSDVNKTTPLIGVISHVEFRGHQTTD